MSGPRVGAPKVGAGFGNSFDLYDADVEPILGGSGDVGMYHDDPYGKPTTNLSTPYKPQSMMEQVEAGFRQVEVFADEIVLTPIERRTCCGMPISRRMSLLIVIGVTGILILVICLGADFVIRSNPVGMDQEDQQRYGQLSTALKPLVGPSITEKGTPEERALSWLASEDRLELNPHTDKMSRVAQRFVVATLFFATNGEKWEDSFSFLSGKHECEWHSKSKLIGAHCNSDKEIDRLILKSNNLDGTLPRDFGLLSKLTHLDLSDNKVKGELPSSIGDLERLINLDLSFNGFTGPLPANTERWTNLETMILDHNNFMKAVPIGYFVDLKALKKLDLSYNIFTGLIHDDWSERWDESNLEELDVSSNVFNGELPRYLEKMSNLKSLNLSDNAFDGSFPLALVQSMTLETVDVSLNHLTGKLPNDIGQDAGTIPLRIFRASKNRLTGTLPTEFGKFVHLEVLELDENGIGGSLPTEIALMNKLQVLDLGSNKFGGSIPSEIGSCVSLHHLELGNNMFSDDIPSELGSLSDLEYLDLQKNDLMGSIPTSFQNLRVLDYLYLSDNAMMGDLDPGLCGRTLAAPWKALEADCVDSLLTCSCCTLCCRNGKGCCVPGTKVCNDLF